MKASTWIIQTDKLAKNEADVTSNIRSWLKANNIWHYKHWQGPMSGANGVSDIIGIYNGRFMALEVKGPKWKPPKSPTAKAWKRYQSQLSFIEQVRQRGGYAGFVQGVSDVVKILQGGVTK